MGTDVLLYAEVKERPSDEALAELCERFDQMCYIGMGLDKEEPEASLRYDAMYPHLSPRIEVWTLYRLDPRGYWPHIYQAIRAMQALFPESEIYYGGDTVDEGALVDEALLEHRWLIWNNYCAYLEEGSK